MGKKSIGVFVAALLLLAPSGRMKSFAALAVTALALAGLLALPATAEADEVKVKKDMKLVGHEPMQARSIYNGWRGGIQSAHRGGRAQR